MDASSFLILAVVVIMGWFAAGVIYNLRRGEALLRWMQGGLPRIGEKTTLRWLGTSVAELVIAKARGAIRRLETLVVLSPRDVPWMWLITHLRGRRDTLIFRARLGVSPRVDLELADPASWTGRMALEQAAGRGWVSQPLEGRQLMAPKGLLGLAQATVDRLEPIARDLDPHCRRFSLRRDPPQLEVHLAFPDRRGGEAGAFFETLQRLARAAGEGNSTLD